jgi:hypothetical protein
MTLIGTLLNASVEAWVWRRIWNVAAGSVVAALEAASKGLACSEAFHGLPSSWVKMRAIGVSPSVRQRKRVRACLASLEYIQPLWILLG